MLHIPGMAELILQSNTLGTGGRADADAAQGAGGRPELMSARTYTGFVDAVEALNVRHGRPVMFAPVESDHLSALAAAERKVSASSTTGVLLHYYLLMTGY